MHNTTMHIDIYSLSLTYFSKTDRFVAFLTEKCWSTIRIHKINKQTLQGNCYNLTYFFCFRSRAHGVQIRWPQGNCRGPLSKCTHIAHCNRSSLVGISGKVFVIILFDMDLVITYHLGSKYIRMTYQTEVPAFIAECELRKWNHISNLAYIYVVPDVAACVRGLNSLNPV